MAGLILHNSAEFLSCLFLKQLLHPQSSVGVPPPLLSPCSPLHSVRSGLTRRVGGGGTCTLEDFLTGEPGVHGCVFVCVQGGNDFRRVGGAQAKYMVLRVSW